jgi:predicted RNA-binding protein with PUA-like domain
MWLLKTEPAAYSWADLVREGRTTWDGVKNPVALAHLRAMRPGDQVLIYHTGTERAVVGVARVVSSPAPDPKARNPRLVVVDLEPVRPLRRPVPLAALKADPRFSESPLIRQPRLSVMPVTAAQWRAVLDHADG